MGSESGECMCRIFRLSCLGHQSEFIRTPPARGLMAPCATGHFASLASFDKVLLLWLFPVVAAASSGPRQGKYCRFGKRLSVIPAGGAKFAPCHAELP